MQLTKGGLRALSYHAGMSAEKRMEVQDRFMKEKNITVFNFPYQTSVWSSF